MGANNSDMNYDFENNFAIEVHKEGKIEQDQSNTEAEGKTEAEAFQGKLQKFEQDQSNRRKELALELRGKENNAEDLGYTACAAKKIRMNKEDAWDYMVGALGISKKDMARTKRQGTLRSVVNMFYLLVIVGCELDLYGFMMAYSTYWYMGYMVVNILLIIAPVGYLIAIILYMHNFNAKRMPSDPKDHIPTKNTVDMVSKVLQLEKERKDIHFSPEDLPEMKPERAPIKLEYYHFVPILRYYLVIKDKNQADVEGIFRVNSLSSFTLGIAQIISIVFQIFVANHDMTVFVKINIGSQIINWIITLLYFMTSVSDKMATSIQIDALAANSREGLRKCKENHMELTRQGAYTGNLTEAHAFEKVIDREISFTSGVKDVDLSIYPMEYKFKALRLLREISVFGYAEI